MAIEWTIESGSAVSPGQLVRTTTTLLGTVLGVAPDDVHAAAGGEQAVAEFELTLRVGASAATVSSDAEVDDDGTPDAERIYATVTAQRTQLSAAVALVTAVALVELSDGELSGPGLDQRYHAVDVGWLVDDLTRTAAPAGNPRAAASRLAVRFGWTTLP